jgi:DNA polymerase-3 subunit epsilon
MNWPEDSAGQAVNPLNANSWVYGAMLGFDLETTGTDPYECSSVDIALVLDPGNGSLPEVHQWLVNPGIEIPLQATAIHGINTETAREKGLPIRVAMAEMAYQLQVIEMAWGHLPIAIYNAGYDVPIIIRESEGLIGLDWTILDAMVLDKSLDAYRPGKRTLTAVNAAYGLAVRNAHRAAGDALSAINVTRAIGKQHYRAGNTLPRDLHKMQIAAYREQMEQFINYQRTHGNPEFQCPTVWPYDAKRLFPDG